MESKETNDGDDIPTSTSPPLRNEDVRSNSSPNELGNFDWIVDEVIGDGAVNVNNPMPQPRPSGSQGYRIFRTAAGQQFPANQNIGVQNHMFPHRIPLQLAAAGQQVPANQNSVVQGYIFPQGVPFQLAGQVRSVVRGRGTAQASNNPTGPSQWRYPALVSPVFYPSFTAHPHLVAHPVQQTTKPQTDSSTSESIQAAPSPAPPVQTAPFPPKTQIFYPVSQTAAAWTVHPLSPFIPCHVVQGNFGQSQTTAPIQPASRLTSPDYTFGPVIPVGRLAQASNAPVRPSSNRSTNQACQFRPSSNRSTNQACQFRPSSNRSAYKTHPVRPSSNRSAYKTHPVQPSRTPQSQTDFSDLHALAQATKDFPTDHIKQDFDKPPRRSGRECFFCKRDLSCTPEADGPISQPSILPSVAVLPCSHYFHTRCLEIVTPPEKSADPLCILCDLDENAS